MPPTHLGSASGRIGAIFIGTLVLLGACSPPDAIAQEAAAPGSRDLLSAIASLRAKGCDGQPGTAVRLRPVPALDQAARRMAQGSSGEQAAKAAGYRPVRLLTINLSGPRSEGSVASELSQKYCKRIVDPLLTDFGSHRQGNSWWIAFATPFNPPAESAATNVGARVLALVNEVRSHARSCGEHHFDPAGPLKPNALLDKAAAVQAHDMAAHGYLDHTGRDGSSAADRATRSGYRWRAVGENIASGQTTPEQVVREWTASPEHCANLMNPEFVDMGIAYAVNKDSPQGIYWAQAFGRPR